MNIIERILYVFIFAVVIILIFRFVSGPEDSWICDDGEWVRHGNPVSLPPARPCNQ